MTRIRVHCEVIGALPTCQLAVIDGRGRVVQVSEFDILMSIVYPDPATGYCVLGVSDDMV